MDSYKCKKNIALKINLTANRIYFLNKLKYVFEGT